jgi:sugar phosphate isomerase/epimerase
MKRGAETAVYSAIMNRRRFLQSIAALAAVPAFAAETPWKLNYMLASSMYGSLPLAEILPEVKKTGATAIELWPKKHGTQREEMDAMGHDKFATLLQEHGVGFGGTTRYDLGPFKLTDEVAIVKKFGGSFIVTGGAGEWKNITPEQLKANVKDFVEKMKPHAAFAAETRCRDRHREPRQQPHRHAGFTAVAG